MVNGRLQPERTALAVSVLFMWPSLSAWRQEQGGPDKPQLPRCPRPTR